jgi:hypothetical protein
MLKVAPKKFEKNQVQKPFFEEIIQKSYLACKFLIFHTFWRATGPQRAPCGALVGTPISRPSTVTSF